tara:strand:+ start:346 stop:549 length:204 start_codon:yes stop_codon:yes gene_type:complete
MKEEDKKLLREHLFITVYAQMICIIDLTDDDAITATNTIVDSVLKGDGEDIQEITIKLITELLNKNK